VSGRLARARELLRQRLSRRGLGPAVALPLPLAAPAGVEQLTAGMAVTFAAGLALDSPAAALAREALRTMLMSKLRLVESLRRLVDSTVPTAVPTAICQVTREHVCRDVPLPGVPRSATTARSLVYQPITPGAVRSDLALSPAMSDRASDLVQIAGSRRFSL